LQVVRAKKAVVSNASMWDTLDLLPPDVGPKSYKDKVQATPQCESFMHLHLGFDAEVCFLTHHMNSDLAKQFFQDCLSILVCYISNCNDQNH
jgi:phytoene dehydrogenase-like protein